MRREVRLLPFLGVLLALASCRSPVSPVGEFPEQGNANRATGPTPSDAARLEQAARAGVTPTVRDRVPEARDISLWWSHDDLIVWFRGKAPNPHDPPFYGPSTPGGFSFLVAFKLADSAEEPEGAGSFPRAPWFVEPVPGDDTRVQVASYADHQVVYTAALTSHGSDFSFRIPHAVIAPLGRDYRWQLFTTALINTDGSVSERHYSGYVYASTTHPQGVGQFESFYDRAR